MMHIAGSMEWEQVDATIGTRPTEMSSHAATAIDEHKMVIFGGTKDNVFYNHAFVLDTGKCLDLICNVIDINTYICRDIFEENVHGTSGEKS